MFMKDMIVTTLGSVGKFVDWVRSAKSESLADYTRVTRVEPVVLVDSAAVYLPYMHDVMQSLSSMFAGYYLQAVALSVNVGKIDTIKLLEKLNPERSPAETAGMFIGNALYNEENYARKLPDLDRLVSRVSFEAFDDRPMGKGAPPARIHVMAGGHLSINNTDARTDNRMDMRTDSRNYGESGNGGGQEGSEHSLATFGRDTRMAAQSVANLCAGMLLEVNIESQGDKATIPVSIRLIVSSTGSESMIHILSAAEKDQSVKERYHAWRAGQIEFIKDGVLCQDIIDDYRAARIKDKSGFYDIVTNRRNKNRVSAVFSGEPSVATASNIFVLTTPTAAKLEAEIGGSLENFKVRQRIFDHTYTMLIVVIDPAWEHVTIYHRGISMPTKLTVKELKSANRAGGPDVAEILKAYQLGNSPTI